MSEQRICAVSDQTFEVRPEDLAYYKKMGVPLPQLSPIERYRRRHGWVNDYVFYKGTCASTGKALISLYPPNSPYTVISHDAWFDEARDDKQHGRDFDFRRPFFEQFDELLHAVPHMATIIGFSENCSYCESIAHCRNCYLISECSNCEDCLYSYWIQKTLFSVDCAYCHACERCYECSDCLNCYRLHYSQNCSNSFFLDNCIACSDCFMCTNLRHAKFCVRNEQLTEQAYRAFIAEFDSGSRQTVASRWSEFDEFLRTQPRKHLQIENSENCTGNYIRNAKNCHFVFHCYDAEECSYGEHIWRGAKYCMDSNSAGRNAELLYETTNSGIDSYNIKFSRYCWGCRDTDYSNHCLNSHDIFGCAGLKPQNAYCILNKQYSKDDYHQLRARIVAHMKETEEWGEFFPLSISIFGYNTTISGDMLPLTREEVLERGWKWEDSEVGTFSEPSLSDIPDSISEVEDSICAEVLACNTSGRNFRIANAELSFYKEGNHPIPSDCFDVRHRRRLARRGGMELFKRQCARSAKEITTTFHPDEDVKVLSSEEYRRMVYG